MTSAAGAGRIIHTDIRELIKMRATFRWEGDLQRPLALLVACKQRGCELLNKGLPMMTNYMLSEAELNL